MLSHDIIIRPIITEKTMRDMPNKKYTFKVSKSAGKIEIEFYNHEDLDRLIDLMGNM